MSVFIYFRCAISPLARQHGYELICCPYEESCYEKAGVSHLSFR